MRSRLEPMKKVARMLRAHEELILNWFRAKGEISSGAVEGLNNKIRVVTRRSYGFRTYEAMEIALYHTLGTTPGTGIYPQILLTRQKSKAGHSRPDQFFGISGSGRIDQDRRPTHLFWIWFDLQFCHGVKPLPSLRNIRT